MKNFLLIVFWIVLIFLINMYGRYLFVEYFQGGFRMFAMFYLEVAGSIATIVSIAFFFIVNYVINRKIADSNTFSLSVLRFLIMLLSILLVFVGERAYLLLSNYVVIHT